jgi:hypothetical protein
MGIKMVTTYPALSKLIFGFMSADALENKKANKITKFAVIIVIVIKIVKEKSIDTQPAKKKENGGKTCGKTIFPRKMFSRFRIFVVEVFKKEQWPFGLLQLTPKSFISFCFSSLFSIFPIRRKTFIIN